MYPTRLFALMAIALAALLSSGSVANAVPRPPISAIRYTVKTPYGKVDAGAAQIQVDAEQQRVINIVRDFGNYTRPVHGCLLAGSNTPGGR